MIPLNNIVPRIIIWRMLWEIIFFHISAVIKLSNLEYGFLSNSSSDGGSVARANEANVSMIKLIQSIWIGFKGDSFKTAAPVKANTKATTLTVNWNCKNFLIESNIFRPHFIAVTIDLKLSSRRMIPAAYLATYVPAIPIANPMSAFLRAGASLVPSPVIATTWSNCLSPVAIMYLSVGEERAKTFRLFATFLKFYRLPTDY